MKDERVLKSNLVRGTTDRVGDSVFESRSDE